MRLPHRWERVLHNFGEYIECLWKYELYRCAVSKVTAALPKLKFQPSYITKYKYNNNNNNMNFNHNNFHFNWKLFIFAEF